MGAIDFLTKDFEKGRLAYVIQKFLNPDKVYKNLEAFVFIEEKGLQIVLDRILSSRGFKVTVTDDFEIAKKTLNERINKIDFALLSIGKQKDHGLKLLKIIRIDHGRKELPTLAINSNIDQERNLEFIEHGGDDFFVLPLVKEIILFRVDAYMKNYMMQKGMKQDIQKLKDQLEGISGSINRLLEGF